MLPSLSPLSPVAPSLRPSEPWPARPSLLWALNLCSASPACGGVFCFIFSRLFFFFLLMCFFACFVYGLQFQLFLSTSRINTNNHHKISSKPSPLRGFPGLWWSGGFGRETLALWAGRAVGGISVPSKITVSQCLQWLGWEVGDAAGAKSISPAACPGVGPDSKSNQLLLVGSSAAVGAHPSRGCLSGHTGVL